MLLYENETEKIIKACMNVFNELGNGFLEAVYQEALAIEFGIMNIPFNGQEYLGLYPYLEYSQVSGQNRYEFWVYDQKEHNKYRVLKEWLKGYDLLNH